LGPKDWIALAGVLSTAVISLVSLLLSRRREVLQQERDDRLRREQEEREYIIREQERKFVPHVEHGIVCNTFGPEGADYIVELILDVFNKGSVRRKFRSMRFRIRGIKAGGDLIFWEGLGQHRLKFPEKLIDDDLVPPSRDNEENYYYVEPGIRQVFTYVTKIPVSVRYILVHVRLESILEKHEHREENVFTAERLFQVESIGMYSGAKAPNSGPQADG